MDRIKFVQSIVRDKRSMVDDVIDFFDQEMLLYELLGPSKHTVSVTGCNSENISFDIKCSKRETNRLSSYLSTIDTKVVEYDRPLELQYKVTSDRSLTIDIFLT